MQNLFYQPNTISIYIHWPFCAKKCPYCDFNSYQSQSPIKYTNWRSAYLKSIKKQEKYFANKIVKTIFFGGGTPSLMEPETVKDIIDYFKNHNAKIDCSAIIKEITLESNPSTFEISRFKDFKIAGINRLSTGVQSFNEANLKFLGRNHNRLEAIKALEESNKIFERTSFDLIMGLPNQTLENWQEDLNIAMPFFKEHISLYQLTIEEGTVFYKNKVKPAEEEMAEGLFNYTVQFLAKQNINQYEISNFAKDGCESLHNLNYWLGGEYVGIGPGAHGRVFYENSWFATVEHKNPTVWLNLADNDEKSNFSELTKVSPQERFDEVIMTALRVKNPLDDNLVKFLDTQKVQKLINEGLLVLNNNKLSATQQGRLVLNYVISSLVV
jgi:putative oxygen-independent coproporphyrinogen III oxidase